MAVAILKYNAGNIQSVIFALQKIGVEPILTNDISELNNADKIIFPGVGEASNTMRYLKEKKLDVFIKNYQKPLLGICLGMQLLCAYSEENHTHCINVFDMKVKRFPHHNLNLLGQKQKVPHVGWNEIHPAKHVLFQNLNQSDMYFVHSYYVEANPYSIADCDYILPFSAAIQKNNFYAVQFHPEKSSQAGLTVLENFLAI